MLRRLVNLLRGRPGTPAAPAAQRSPGVRARPGAGVPPPVAPGQAHDYDGPVTIVYAPNPDHEPDPGEVVWTWVPYEEDARVGKDRPVVVVGRAASNGSTELAVVMLSSKDHSGDARWLVLGSGAWDAADRVSSARLDRVLAVASTAVRREGSALERDRFDRLVSGLSELHGWR